VDDARFKGVRVQRVDPTGPGAALGLAEGDLVDGVGDAFVDNAADLYRLLRDHQSGATVRLHVWRQRVASWGRLVLR
jgi:S1-C subfamily serine protease